MNKNRLKAEEFILTYIEKIAPGGENKNLYIELFEKMSDSAAEREISVLIW